MPTFAEKLGVTAPESSLLQKARQIGLSSPELLEALAVARGCWHYRTPGLEVPNVSEAEFTNEELAIALLSPYLPYSPHTIRLGAAMLGATDNNITTLVDLAAAEKSLGPVRYIAAAGMRYEPENSFWRTLLSRLPDAPAISEGIMPHPSRFVSMTGMTRAGRKPVTIWVRPRVDLAIVNG